MPAQLHVGNVDRDYSEIAREDPTCLYLVANGSAPMSSGKLAAQAFQIAMWMYTHPDVSPEQRAALDAWQAEGARVIARQATTEGMFERVCSELDGVILRDEGLTEVEQGAATIFATWPVRRSQAPKLLANKKIPLLG